MKTVENTGFSAALNDTPSEYIETARHVVIMYQDCLIDWLTIHLTFY